MWNWFVGGLNNIIAGLANVVKSISSILPESPIKAIDNSPVGQYLGYINWIIPVNAMLVEIGLFCTAVFIYYAWQVILRWLKAVE